MEPPVLDHRPAQRHLARRDPVLKTLIARVGPCTLQPEAGAPLEVLARAVVAQLISTKAAATVYARLVARAGAITPEALLALGEDGVRAAGLSGAKARTLLELANRATDGRLPLASLAAQDDGAIRESLLPVRGIGVWTVEMFLIFGLGRPDVLPVGDLGLRMGVQETYALEERPTPPELREMAEAWRPYRSIATWYFWRSRGAVPQS